MIDDNTTAILLKIRDYNNFIKGRLTGESISLKENDLETIKSIDSYLEIVKEDIDRWGGVTPEVSKNILATCIMYLQRLDRIAKDYELFPNENNE